MKKIIRKALTAVIAVCMIFSLSVPALAATSNVIFKNKAEKFVFLPGSEYTDTDLFNGFKNMMPGDSRTQTVVVKNEYTDFKAIKVYLRAIPHGTDNPLSESVAEHETLSSMVDFLRQFSMTVRCNGRVIYNASPNQLDGLSSNVYLGEIAFGETVKLDVQLTLPIDVGNEYANRIGEVDWVFTVEEVEEDPYVPPIIIPSYTRATITAIKLLDGATPDTNEFMFQLTDSTGKVLQTVNNNGADVIFNTITYTQAGTYTYYLTEIPGSDPNMIYDSSVYTVTVNVSGVPGFLRANVSYEKNGMEYNGIPAFFNITDEEEEEIPEEIKPIEVPFIALKIFNKHIASGSDFTFYLHNEKGTVIQTKNNEDGYVIFDGVTIDKAGTYEFYITEHIGDVEDMIYDTSVFKVIVKVVEKDGKLLASYSYEQDGREYNDTPAFINYTEYDPEIPETSDGNLWIYIALAGVCLAAVIVVFVKPKKKNQ